LKHIAGLYYLTKLLHLFISVKWQQLVEQFFDFDMATCDGKHEVEECKGGLCPQKVNFSCSLSIFFTAIIISC